ncbi:NAD(P)/FAD-dependent oxidoreductase [Methanoregula sp. PtaB.Bin085]|jgi:NAD(P)H-nitrite reductase large subunit|uniref:NAD(P)/FAD-dependent oxidoreductase n=1 Tax=Methanoregula sp. PtaB.Bin085 TaxID=1811680 RepID=UPI0009CB766C|nr:NAD(P)/FAD-dependent oxidoreductase [Methanoregula sp. PtaB.Bin085]OPX65604.1 MAG: ferredoxin-nitrite reductase [Methanoregula sp. PtaB.Bin085]
MTGSTKGALLQRDGKRYAVVTRMPAGIVTPDDLEKIAGIGRKYRVPMLKITSGQRFALIGLEPGDVADVFQELGPLAQPESAPCVKFVQACLGTEMCRYGNQDSIGLARALEERFRDQTFPAKIKIGVSGCQRCCGESQIRDLGIMGTNRGWTVFFGGNAGRKARIGDIVASDLTAAEVMDCAGRLLEYYQRNAHAKERTARFMERIGMETLKSELLTLLPYIQIEKVS